MKILVSDAWRGLEFNVQAKNDAVVSECFQGRERPTIAYYIGFNKGFREIKEKVVTAWGVNEYKICRRLKIHRHYPVRKTKKGCAEFSSYVDAYFPTVADVGFCYRYTDSTGSHVSGFQLVEDMVRDRVSFDRDSLLPILAELKEKYDPKDGHIKCEGCGAYRLPADIVQKTIISPNWKNNNYTSPPRNYCKDKPCHGHDQMAHEG